MCFIDSDLALFVFSMPQHTGMISQLKFTNDDCGHRCAHTRETEQFMALFPLRFPPRSRSDKH